ncbi:Maf family protein [Planctomycetota bacterium]
MVEKPLSPIILASASPRRRQLLSEAGFRFTVVTPDVDESIFPTEGIAAREYAETLALAKAKSVAPIYPDHLVIGADTIADFAGEIIGKPNDAKDAERITRKLFSAPHKVITGVAIIRLCDHTELVESDSTIVYPKPMTAGQIAEHIKSGTWRDKAGAYAIQETGDEFVERIEGSLTNVMGLPMELLKSLLAGKLNYQK